MTAATREALIEAIARQAGEQGQRRLAECRIDEGSATEGLTRLVEAWLDLAERYSFPQLIGQPEFKRTGETVEHRRRVYAEPILALIRRGQDAGEFSSAVPPEWGLRAFGALVIAGARAVGEGALTREEASAGVVRTLIGGLRP